MIDTDIAPKGAVICEVHLGAGGFAVDGTAETETTQCDQLENRSRKFTSSPQSRLYTTAGLLLITPNFAMSIILLLRLLEHSCLASY